MPKERMAIVSDQNVSLDTIRDYLPSNYRAAIEEVRRGHFAIVIRGTDRLGWTLDEYVLPRLGSGLIPAREADPDPDRCTDCGEADVSKGRHGPGYCIA